ncbi:type II toxin-antitoxin system VapC family toxin [Micromonospora orduensis]|uniref:Type II toxin-antitoxin system VapC family toxin n=1 Tax=Micromonospora orduensis TaxID=1420891 RepID=A0A5C4QVX1_9ACTN|nr:type II toxin-antitoxin system VapC family toxin [Micromonospora orduensis]TNH30206.1 type II toxin-antitoxin system VapC family toxin [Micromonospora orduensis]
MNGLVLDTSALLAYASGTSVEPGAMLTLAEEDPEQQVWVPALCLGQAQLELAGTAAATMLDLLFTEDRDTQVAVYDAATSRRVARIAARSHVSLDVAHAVATAALYRCYLVTRDPKIVSPVMPPGLEILDISQTWD